MANTPKVLPIKIRQVGESIGLTVPFRTSDDKLSRLVNRSSMINVRLSELLNRTIYNFFQSSYTAFLDARYRVDLLLPMMFDIGDSYAAGGITKSTTLSLSQTQGEYTFTAAEEFELFISFSLGQMRATGTSIRCRITKMTQSAETTQSRFEIEIVGNGSQVGVKHTEIYDHETILTHVKRATPPTPITMARFGYEPSAGIAAMATDFYSSSSIYAQHISPAGNMHSIEYTAGAGDVITTIAVSFGETGAKCYVCIYDVGGDGYISNLLYKTDLITGTTAGNHYIQLAVNAPLAAGKKYRIALQHVSGEFPEVSLSGGFRRYNLVNGEPPNPSSGAGITSNFQRPVWAEVTKG